MTIARTLAALLIALSVALLPAALGATSAASETSVSMAMDDCCPDADEPCDQTGSTCPFMAACALKSGSFSAPAFSEFTYLAEPTIIAPFYESTAALNSEAGSPPLRPPQT
jgi:hypothetical protein